jgi:hypothetical protein
MHFGAILERHPTIDQVEVLLLVGNLELAQKLSHQVGNAKTIQHTLLHLVVGSLELDGLLLDLAHLFVSEASLWSLTNG